MKSVSIFFISIFINTFAYGDLRFNLDDSRCISKEKAKLLEVTINNSNAKPRVFYGKEKYNEKERSIELELKPHDRVKCMYKVSYDKNAKYRSSIDEVGGDVKYASICANISGDINYIEPVSNYADNYPRKILSNDIINKSILMMYPALKYVWQKGECSDLTEKFYNKIKIKTSEEKLIKNKFMLVNENEKYLSYYGNPGYFVKLEKNNKCKKKLKCELNVFVKRYFESAILDVNGKLYTEEEIF